MSKKNKKLISSLIRLLLPLAGVGFLVWYVRAAGADVCYSDYFRIIAEYLPDVGDLSGFLTPDILTRVPAAYLGRLINVRNFGYSVTFDRMLGILGMALMAIVLTLYMKKKDIGIGAAAVVLITLFSLTKWEIILNGTAWTHLLSFGLFFIHYYLIELLWQGETSAWEELALVAMPLLMLLAAGEYIASYALTLILISGFGMLMGGGTRASKNEFRVIRLFRALLTSTVIALALYMISRHFAVWEHAGMSDIGLMELLAEDRTYLLRFFLKSFTGALIGAESSAMLPDMVIICLGVIIILAYLCAVYIFIRTELYEVTILPAILLISGFVNHVLITLSRWRFLDTGYGMSSRYAAQYMPGLIGIVLIFSLWGRQKRALRGMSQGEKNFLKGFMVLAIVLITLGNCYTTYDEVLKAKYREANFEEMGEALLHFDEIDPEEAASLLEWHKDTETLSDAVAILRDNKLNVFR